MDTSSLPIPPALDFDLAVGLTDARGTLLTEGDAETVRPLASVSKPIAALAALVAVSRGLVDLDERAGPPGATVRHLLAHTAGYAFEGGEDAAVQAEPGAKRIYSNTGFDVLAAHVAEATAHPFDEWVEQAVVEPLGLRDLEVTGSAAKDYAGSLTDLLVLGRELLEPTLIPHPLWQDMTTVQFPGLAGILPGYGRQKPNDWGLGVEIRADKSPHWTGASASPGTFGHFGQSGSFLWVDPDRGVAAAFLGAEPFGQKHKDGWPELGDTLLARTDAA
ncbi:MAG: serine hydrolase domain-containing protein [Brachybacterium sp.]|nr:serine hydrolase domain-containing protein [Brachybacterium sp.]